MTTDKPLVGVGAVIVENGKILLVRRGNEPNKNKWTIPGGLVKVGESLTEALKREIREEVGLEIEVGDVACVSEEIIKDDKGIRYHYVIIDFFAKVKGGNLRAGSDALEAKWVSFDEIDELDVVDFVRKLVTNVTLGRSCIYIR